MITRHLFKQKTKLCNFTLMLLMALTTASSCQKEKTQQKPASIKVQTTKVGKTAVADGKTFSATIEESKATSLSFAIAGTVNQVFISDGQHINKGDLIATIDDTAIRNSYDMASTTLLQATDAYNRMKILHDNNSLPEIQWVEVESKLRQAQSSVQIAQRSLSDCRLYAPTSGVISAKNIEIGQNVMPGMQIAQLVKIDNVKVSVAVPENEIATVNKGQNVTLSVPALDGKTFSGTITDKSISANSLSRTYTVKATVANPNKTLMPGMICELTFQTSNSSTHIVLPTQVIQIDNSNRNFVWLNKAGKAETNTQKPILSIKSKP